MLVAFFGGILSFTGIVIGAQLVLPRALRVVGRLAGRAPAARLAAANAVRYPVRSTRATIGLVIGVTLITTFAVAVRTFGDEMQRLVSGAPGFEALLGGLTAVFSLLTGVSAVVAAVGLVANLSLSVLQRTRELGLLRALGFSRPSLRGMIVTESAQLVATATVLGLVLGTVYGWAGAQALLGSLQHRVVPLAAPLGLFGVIALGAVLLTLIAALAPATRAARVSPVAALAAE